jgi:uncharacterized protein
MTERPPTDEYLGEYSGRYQSEVGKDLLVIPGHQRLAYLEPATGHYRVFTPLGRDTFTAGPGFKQAEPTVVTAQFVRDASGQVADLLWSQDSQQLTLGRRVAFTYEEVTFRSGDVILAGTLTKPVNHGPHPAVVMVHGSGPVARHEFQPLTEFFASFGLAVLAYDKRGVGGSSGQWQSTPYPELAEDALAGLNYLRSRPDILSDQTGMWGLSQGGWLVPLAASVSKVVAFIITVSGPGVNPIQQEIWRVEHMLRLDGFSLNVINTALTIKKQGLSLWQSKEADWEAFAKTVERIGNEPWFAYLGFDANPSKDEFLRDQGSILEPTAILEQVSCPVLAIFGELDPFLPVEQSAINFEQALQAGGNADYTIQIIPKGNHVLFQAVTGSMHEQPNLPGYVPQYLTLMHHWLQERLTLGNERYT